MRVVAAFDFDGTLTRRDTLLPFLLASVGARRAALGGLASSLAVTRALVADRSRDQAKEALLSRILAGRPVDELQRAGEAFADAVVPLRIRGEMWDRIEEHRALGHELVIVSASPELYVEPVGRRLGFHATIATRLEVDDAGRVTGRLAGPNCRGPEKVRRLEEWAGGEVVQVRAYGDSRGDRELLALAGEGGTWVGRRGRRQRRGA